VCVSKMNGTTRKKLYKMISNRDGEYCKGCSKLPSEGQLVVDHRDNNNSNNSLRNLQLLCRTCNFIKNQKRPVDKCVREFNARAATRTIPVPKLQLNVPITDKYTASRAVPELVAAEIEINRTKETQYQKEVFSELPF